MKCPYCENLLPPNVNNCPSCGAPVEQQAAAARQQQFSQPVSQLQANIPGTFAHSLWMSIVSLIFGILCFLAAFDEGEWDEDTILGFIMFLAIAFVFGIIVCVKEKIKKGAKGMAIAGMILAVISLLVA